MEPRNATKMFYHFLKKHYWVKHPRFPEFGFSTGFFLLFLYCAFI